MDAQALVLPIDRSDLAQFDGDDEEEQKQRDAWERDPYTGVRGTVVFLPAIY